MSIVICTSYIAEVLWTNDEVPIMNIIFFGSDDFAAIHLEALIGSKHKVLACVTQPDKARGRGMQVSASLVKETALRKNVAVLQPTDLKDDAFVKALKAYNADLFVVIAYGRFLPPVILTLPRTLAINVHSSLLPKYRGAAPINWAVINGEQETGLTIMQVSDKMDAGDIITQENVKISNEDTAMGLRARMMEIGPKLLLKTIDSIEKQTYTLKSQDHKAATLAPKLTKELGHIQWGKPAAVLHNLVRALLPWPTAYTHYQGKLLKILETEVVSEDFCAYQPGEVAKIDKNGFTVATANKGLLVKKVHLESAKPMPAYQFVTGHQLQPGFNFNNQETITKE